MIQQAICLVLDSSLSEGFSTRIANEIRNIFQRLYRVHRNRGDDERRDRFRLYVEDMQSLMVWEIEFENVFTGWCRVRQQSWNLRWEVKIFGVVEWATLKPQRRSVENCGAHSYVPGWHAQIGKRVAFVISLHRLTWTACAVETCETLFGTSENRLQRFRLSLCKIRPFLVGQLSLFLPVVANCRFTLS